MKIDGIAYRSVWVDPEDGWSIRIFDQTRLPWSLDILRLTTHDQVAHAIATMQVRGAPLIGAVAAYGLALALRADSSTDAMERDAERLAGTRPTAVNLRWAIERMLTRLRNTLPAARVQVAYEEAGRICDEDAEQNAAIGRHGLTLIEQVATAKARLAGTRSEKNPESSINPKGGANNEGRTSHPDRVNVLTHCNAGWIATVDWGTALAPIYMAHDKGIDVHVWVDETRPRNQGAALTAWELGRHGVAHTVIPDNAGGHLMQHGEVDLVIVGTDRVTRNGDVANKIGTYLKALAAHDNAIPFWVALPSTTIDWRMRDGVREIEIEERNAGEVTHMTGRMQSGELATVQITPDGSNVANPAFDVTPARLVSGLITERGRCDASAAGLAGLFPEEA